MRNILSFHRSPPAPEPPFTPGANTIFYFPFSSDATDMSGNGYVLSNAGGVSGTGTQDTLGRTFAGVGIEYNKTVQETDYFCAAWIKVNNKGSGYTSSEDSNRVSIVGTIPGYTDYILHSYWNSSWDDYISYTITGEVAFHKTISAPLNTWMHIAFRYSSTSGAGCHINGVKYVLSTNPNAFSGWGPGGNTFLFTHKGSTKASVTLSEVIAERVIRTDQKILDYFNATKATYGVS